MARTRVLNELNRLNQFIVDCEVRIEAQRQRIDWIKQGGGNAEDSEKLLNNLISSSSALTRLRLTVVEELREREN
ncbi:hypothetical protein [Caballeronia sp. LZ032]|uniref:hypothetical protein n=1 Tax=Caballeronia sp. LZ032 TaxID=3038565 RepID=UPI0028653AC8|nr:hypothetical protein [Caballeronia sp. LZ032]MDR5879817.1 hypothetical protein [Caballeronia sp. LZ032]